MADFDPTVALGVRPPAPPAADPGGPLGMVSAYAALQQRANAVRQFNQQFAARQRAGQIIAGAPDLETGLQAAQGDPLVAGFAPDVLQSLRATQQTLTTTQGLQAGQNRDALQAVIKAQAASLADPSTFGANIKTQMDLLPADVRARVAPAVGDLVTSLTAPGPDGQPVTRQQFNARTVGNLTGAGIGPEAVNGLLGTPGGQALGNRYQGTLQLPSYLGGATVPAGGPMVTGASPAPTEVTVGAEGQKQTIIPHDQTGLGTPGGGGPLMGGAATPTTTTLGVPSPGVGQAETLRTQAEAGTKLGQDIATRAQALPDLIDTNNALFSLLSRFQAGGGADARTKLGQGLQALQHAFPGLGITNDQVNSVANSDLGVSQAFSAIMRSFLTRALSGDVQGQGRTFLPEVTNALDAASASTDPGALVTILDRARHKLAQEQDFIGKFPGYRANLPPGYNVSDYPTWYGSKYSPLDSVTDANEHPPGMQTGPVPQTQARGVAAGPLPTMNNVNDVLQALNAGFLPGGLDQARDIIRQRGWRVPPRSN
jgi:hypothetical protein